MNGAKHGARKYTNKNLYELLEEEVSGGRVNKFYDEKNPNLVGYSYDRSCMIDGYWNDCTTIARGIVLNEKTKEIVALPFEKFFNLGERGDTLPNEEFEVFEKVDGCFLSETKLNLWGGGTIEIGEVVKNKLTPTLIGVDKHGNLIPSKVTDWHNNGEKDNWMEIEVDYLDTRGSESENTTTKIKVTSNHEIFFNNDWGIALDIKEGDVVQACKKTPCEHEPFTKIDCKVLSVRHLKNTEKNFPNGRVGFDISTETENYFCEGILVHNSLGILYNHKGEWKINTRGSFKSEQAVWAKEFFDKNANKTNLDNACTYCFEIIYASNRIVVDYQGNDQLVLLGGYHNDGLEISLDEVCSHFNVDKVTGSEFIRPAKTYKGKSIADLVHIAENELSENEEGYVVKFSGGKRVKIKGARYCHLHKILSDFSEKRVMEYVRDTPNINVFEEEFFNSMPEEFQIDFYTYYNKYETLFNSLVADALKFASENKLAHCKDIGLLQKEGKVTGVTAKLFFMIKRGRFKNIYSKSKERNYIFKIITS